MKKPSWIITEEEAKLQVVKNYEIVWQKEGEQIYPQIILFCVNGDKVILTFEVVSTGVYCHDFQLDGATCYVLEMKLQHYLKIVDLLRNEKPIYFNYFQNSLGGKRVRLGSAKESVGEGDVEHTTNLLSYSLIVSKLKEEQVSELDIKNIINNLNKLVLEGLSSIDVDLVGKQITGSRAFRTSFKKDPKGTISRKGIKLRPKSSR